jgi:hypothetical protein
MNVSSILLSGKTFYFIGKILYIDVRVVFDFNKQGQDCTDQSEHAAM